MNIIKKHVHRWLIGVTVAAVAVGGIVTAGAANPAWNGGAGSFGHGLAGWFQHVHGNTNSADLDALAKALGVQPDALRQAFTQAAKDQKDAFITDVAGKLGIQPGALQQAFDTVQKQRRDALLNDVAGKLGIEPSALQAAFTPAQQDSNGKPLSDLAAKLGVQPQALRQAFAQARKDQKGTLLNDLATQLGVQPSALQQAFTEARKDAKKGAFIDAVAAKLGVQPSTLQAAMRQLKAGHRFWGRGHGQDGYLFQAAAGYLGLTPTQLFADLGSGQSLAQVAQAQGKDVNSLKQALTNAFQSNLDQFVNRTWKHASDGRGWGHRHHGPMDGAGWGGMNQ